MVLLEEIVKLSAREVREEKERRGMEMQLQRMLAEGKERAVDVTNAAEETQATTGLMSSKSKTSCNRDGPHSGQGLATEDNKQVVPPATSDVADTKVTDEGEPIASKQENASKETPKVDTTIPKTEETITQPPRDNTIHPHEFNEATLMNIFNFLDPLDVMNFAQINKAMFTRIDVLFGMGGSSSHGRNDGNEAVANVSADAQVPSAARPPLPLTPATPAVVAPAPAPAVVPSSASVTSVNSGQSAGTAPKTSPKLFAMPSPSIPSIVGPASGSSWLSRFGATTETASTTTASTNTPTHNRVPSTSSIGSSTNPTPETEIKLNAAMATSMASKLTPAELSVILRMREKLQKCESDAAKWKLEKEDAVANLSSVRAVKEFLVTRVRDMEKMVEAQKEEMKEVQRKNLADQEIIVYLDERVKKLEDEVNDTKSKEASTKQEAADVVAKNEKKVRVLSDMLRFEREQISSNEKEWKNTKKLLVKEVKSCRSHIVSLEAELEGLRRQNEQLKEGLRVLSPSRGIKGLKLR